MVNSNGVVEKKVLFIVVNLREELNNYSSVNQSGFDESFVNNKIEWREVCCVSVGRIWLDVKDMKFKFPRHSMKQVEVWQ